MIFEKAIGYNNLKIVESNNFITLKLPSLLGRVKKHNQKKAIDSILWLAM